VCCLTSIFADHAARFLVFAEYQRKLVRTIPVIRLESPARLTARRDR